MAVCADRRLPVALRNGLSVNALLELCGDLVVALAAGQRNIEFKDRRLGIFGVQDFVGAMAVRADGSFFGARSDRVAVDALLVRCDHLRADTTIFHHEFLTMAGSARGWDVGVMHLRFGVGRGKQFMRTAVAIDASGCIGVSALNGLRVKAAVVSGLFVGVAGRATDLLRGCFVRGAGDVSVTIDAREHAAVDGVFELLRIDLQADVLSVDFVRQAGITVTGEALICSGLGWFFFRCRQGKTRG